MRLIDADALLKYKTDHEMISTHYIYNAPTVTERKKGKWIYHTEPLACNPYGHYTCNLCNEISWDESNYCPNCGADMRRKESEVDE